MSASEYRRRCKQFGCDAEFLVSSTSLVVDRTIGYSEPEYCPDHRARHAKSYSRIAAHHLDVEMTELGDGLVLAMERAAARGEERTLGPGGLGMLKRPLRPFIEGGNAEHVLPEFPIAEKDGEILAALEDHQVVVLVGPTGSGKSTHVPHLLLRSKWSRRGPIVVTQPRIQATARIPMFVARLNDSSCGPGADIGYSHSKAEEYDRRTRLLFMTDGKLINDIVSGAIANYSVIMIDEAHERSVNIDLILGLLREQLYLYPHLRLIVASATIDHDSFVRFFGGDSRVPFIEAKGKLYEVVEHYWGEAGDDWWQSVNGGVAPERGELPDAVADVVAWLCRTTGGPATAPGETRKDHILVFLPGSREIDAAVSAIEARGLPDVLPLPLYAQRPLDEQDRALEPKDPRDRRRRRVVVSTNVAETSLTVEGVRYVIDCGYIKQPYWNSALEVNELLTVRHSKDGCKQRWGRAGRLMAGDAYLLYTREEFGRDFPPHSSPDIARASLEQVVLSALAAGVHDLETFAWMPLSDRDDQKRFSYELRRAVVALQASGAIDGAGDLTAFGLELRGVPSALDTAAIFGEADRYALGVEAATLLPFLKLDSGLQALLRWDRAWEPDRKLRARRFQLDLTFGCRDDLDVYVKLWALWEALGAAWVDLQEGVDTRMMREQVERDRERLLGSLMDRRKAERRGVLLEKLDAFRALIACCLPREVYEPERGTTASAGSVGYLDWESYWDETDHYEETDEGLGDAGGFGGAAGRLAGVYRRSQTRATESADEARVELAPVSVAYGRDLERFVICQRRANYLRPARARILGFNVVRVDPAWMPALSGDEVARAFLFASLTRERALAEHRQTVRRLFLPWLLPRGTEVCGAITEIDGDGTIKVALAFEVKAGPLAALVPLGAVRVEGELSPATAGSEPAPVKGAEVCARVVDYVERAGYPVVVLARPVADGGAFQEFARRYRVGSTVEVEMVRILPDPLGLRPLFLVRERVTGVELPMSAGDFCGGTRFHAWYGQRFAIGEGFSVRVSLLDVAGRRVRLSRIDQLIEEYERIPAAWDQIIRPVKVSRVEKGAVYLDLDTGGPPYIASVREALWPAGFQPRRGASVPARVRKYNRNVDVAAVRQRLRDGEPLPAELDLGVELDLRLPPAYMAFAEHHVVGSMIDGVQVVRPIGTNGLLVDLGDGLHGMVYESELGLSEGNLARPKDYPPGARVNVRVVKMNAERARVECSVFRYLPLPPHLVSGEVVQARVLLLRAERGSQDVFHVTGSVEDRYRIHVVVRGGLPVMRAGDVVDVRVDHREGARAYLGGSLV